MRILFFHTTSKVRVDIHYKDETIKYRPVEQLISDYFYLGANIMVL